MTRTSRLLRRLVVVGAGTAVIATGVVPLAEGVAFASTGSNATSATISPTSDSETAGNCNPFTVTTQANAKFDVQISQTSAANPTTTTIDFCDVTGFTSLTAADNAQNYQGTGTCPASGTGGAAGQTTPLKCSSQLTADANGKVTFGVYSDTAGSMAVQVYDDVNNNNVYESGIDTNLTSASKTWVANTVASLACQPDNTSQQTGTTFNWTCQANTASGTGVSDDTAAPLIRFTVSSGPEVGQNGTCTYHAANDTEGTYGKYDCSLANGGTAGTDTIVVYNDKDNDSAFDSGTEPSTTIHVTFVAPAPAGSTITVTCSPNQTTPDACEDPLTDGNATFTATVKTSGGAAASGVLVDWSITGGAGYDAGDTESLSAASCTTAADGTCSTELTDTNPTQDEVITVQGATTVANDSATKEFHDPNPSEARNITVAPASATQQSGGAQGFTATVTDRFGNPVKNACVGWTESGAGRFTAPNTNNCGSDPQGTSGGNSAGDYGVYGTTCFTNAQGKCSVEVTTTTTETGEEDLTAAIDNDANSNEFHNLTTGTTTAEQECAQPAEKTLGDTDNDHFHTVPSDPAPGAPAGNCSASAKVTWGPVTPPPPHGRTSIKLKLSCFSHRPHHATCVAQTSPAFSGVTVIFYNKKGHRVGIDVTGKAGKAKIHKSHLKSGKHKYYAHARHTSRTFAATSKLATFFVQ